MRNYGITFFFNIRVSPRAFLACIFCQSLGHHINNYPYQSSRILPTQIVLVDYKPYSMSKMFKIRFLFQHYHMYIVKRQLFHTSLFPL